MKYTIAPKPSDSNPLECFLFSNIKELPIEIQNDIYLHTSKLTEPTTFFLRGSLYIFSTQERDDLRQAGDLLTGFISGKNYTSTSIIPAFDAISNPSTYAQCLCEGIFLGGYTFERYLSEKTSGEHTIFISNTNISKKDLCKHDEFNGGVAWATTVCNNVNLTKDFINTPPCDFFPLTMVQKVKEHFGNLKNCSFEILDEDRLSNEGMNAMLAVSKASQHNAYCIKITYKPNKPKFKMALVGKGLTYDSGGLSLKGAENMVTMKADKSGACSVFGIIKTLAELDVQAEVHGYLGMVENMIGGDAYKPDDVLISRSKISIEVKNTDAEGRLVLADVLSYAQDQDKYDYLFDFATLTGACVVGLGEYTFGLMGANESLKEDIVKNGSDVSGDFACSLKFNKHLKKLIKTPIADVCNISSSKYGGSLTAGLFLEKFITDANKDKWIHFDIAGPAYVNNKWGINSAGASGIPVKTMVTWIQTKSIEGK